MLLNFVQNQFPNMHRAQRMNKQVAIYTLLQKIFKMVKQKIINSFKVGFLNEAQNKLTY